MIEHSQISHIKTLRDMAQHYFSEAEKNQAVGSQLSQVADSLEAKKTEQLAKFSTSELSGLTWETQDNSTNPENMNLPLPRREPINMNEIKVWVENRIRQTGYVYREEIDSTFPQMRPKSISNLLYIYFRYDKLTKKWSLKDKSISN